MMEGVARNLQNVFISANLTSVKKSVDKENVVNAIFFVDRINPVNIVELLKARCGKFGDLGVK